jgi:inner membrane protein
MSPITHLLSGWVLLSNVPRETTRRERVIVAIGAIIPDVDGLGIVPDAVTRHFMQEPTSFFHQWHHRLHCLPFALVATALATAIAPKGARARTALLFFVAFHLHLLCDVIGARGPDGNQWPIPYLWPFHGPELLWSGQWALNAWPNFVITGALLVATAILGVRRGHTVVEVVSSKADAAVVDTLRRRFGKAPAGERPAEKPPA